MNELLKTYDYNTNKYVPMEGTEDWIEVGQLGDGGGSYDWIEFRAFYSPSARRYFWHGDSGCSCNGWDDDLSTAADFEDGERAALLRAWETFPMPSATTSPTPITPMAYLSSRPSRSQSDRRRDNRPGIP